MVENEIIKNLKSDFLYKNLSIKGLLKVAVENARVQEKQIQAEKRELKMELYREREMRESLERQLTSELQSRG